MTRRYVYHYCAEHQGNLGSLTKIDGIALMVEPIKDMHAYGALKDIIVKNHRLYPERITILSLSFLGLEQK